LLRKISAEELTKQHLGGKSINQLSQETGIGQWAIRKQIQRHRQKQQVIQQQKQQQDTAELGDKEISNAILAPQRTRPAKESPMKVLAIIIGVMASMAATYLIYVKIKRDRLNKTPE